jgi:glutathione synthase/RimK-type ligase-like ATP-grasp enzyme
MFETLPEQVFANAPQATDRAANKIVQLRAATTCSLRIPKTLVSSDRREIVDFIKGLPRRAIVKTLIGTAKSIVFTNTITLEDIEGALVESVPGIYQECIEGYCHLRLNVFGQKIVGARIRSEELDWRRLLPRDVEIVQVESGLHSSVLSLMNRLNLQMGMVDLKINGQGDIVFLEVNPQGQFLFLEPLTGYPFRSEFADFLLNTSQDGERN